MDKQTLEALALCRQAARKMGSAAGLQKIAAAGKLDARARIATLLDAESFVELGVLARSQNAELSARTPADGLIAGHGTIDGRLVYITSEDASVLGGTRGRVAEVKMARIRELALRHRAPFIALMEAGAGRFQETNGATAASAGSRFKGHFQLSGRVPQVAALMGGCFGGPSFTAMQSDFVTIVKGTGFMGMSGPKVVEIGIGQKVTPDEIGGAEFSTRVTGQADHMGQDDRDSLMAIRRFLSYFPSSCEVLPPRLAPVAAGVDTAAGADELDALIPENGRRAYAMERVLALLLDGGASFAYRADYGAGLITAWARIDGRSVGVIASNPKRGAGALDEKAAHKARKFIDICNAFHIPLIFLNDCPGFIVGPEIEKHRMVSLAARLLNSLMAAEVPKITVVVRKAIGLAYIALGGKSTGPDQIVGWPTAEFDVMGTAAGVELIHGREIAESADPAATRAAYLEQFRAEASGYRAAEAALIDDIILPSETRAMIIDTLNRACAVQTAGFTQRIDP